MGFDRTKFLTASTSGNDGTYFTPPAGFYVMTLESAMTGNSKASNRFQVVFQWKISEDDEKFANKNCYQTIGLDGPQCDKGYEQLNRLINRLNYKGDPESFAVDPDGELSKLVGTSVRMAIKPNEKNPDFPFYNVQKVMYSPLEGEVGQTNVSPEDTDLLAPNPEVGDEDTVEVGDELNVTDKTGQFLAIVQMINESTNQVIVKKVSNGETTVAAVDQIAMSRKAADVKKNPSGMPITTVTNAAKQPAVKELAKPMETVADELPEEIEELEQLKLEIGMMVEGKYKDDKIVGKVHHIDTNSGIVKINMGGKAYPCKLDTIKLIS